MALQGMTLHVSHSSQFTWASAGLQVSLCEEFVGLDSRVEAKLSSEKSLRLPSQEVEMSEAAERPVRDSSKLELELTVERRGTWASSSVVLLHHFKGNSTAWAQSLPPEPKV